MPIKGLTDRKLAFPEIGQIRKGAKKDPNGNKPGLDLEYFRIEFDEKEVETAAIFNKAYGDKPTEINIVLPFNDIPRMWDAWLEAYTAGRMVARSDGEYFSYRINPDDGKTMVLNGNPSMKHEDVVGHYIDKNGKKQPITCKPTGRLKVIVRELFRAAYLTVMTTSIADIGNISAQLDALKELNNGQIAGIPLVLRRRPKKISTPMPGGQRARRVKWLLSIEANPKWVKAKLMQVQSLATPKVAALLPGDEQEEEFIDVESRYPDDDEEEPEIPQPVAIMDIEEAKNYTDSHGVKYSTMPLNQLPAKHSLIETALKANGLTKEQTSELKKKRDAIRTLWHQEPTDG